MANMAILHLLPLLAFSTGFKLPDNPAIDTAIDFFQDFVTSPDSYFDSIGVRSRRAVDPEEFPGFKIYAIPFTGVEIGVKADISSGREVFIEVEDFKRLVPEVDLKKVTVHVQFDGEDFRTNGLFHAYLQYKLEVNNALGVYETVEGTVKVVRKLLDDGTWETFIKTENPWALRHKGSARAISSMHFQLLTVDWLKMIQGRYLNPTLGQDLKVKFVRSKYNISSADKEIAFAVEVVDKDETYTGEVAAKLTPGRHQKVLVNINKGSTKLLEVQLMLTINNGWTDFDMQGNFILSGVEHGRASATFKDNSLALAVGSYQLRVEIHPGESVTIVVEKEDKVLWSFNSLLECKSKPGLFHKVLTADVSHLDQAEPKEISLNAVIVVDSAKKHLLRLGTTKVLPFKVEFEIFEEQKKFVHFIADTTTVDSPYRLTFWSPELLKQEDLTLTVNHERGLVFDVNIFGGLRLDLHRAPPNRYGGRALSITASQAGVEMFKYDGETKEVNNEDMLLIGFESSLDLIQDVGTDRVKREVARKAGVVVNRKVKLEFFWDKKKKNGVLNMFHILGKLEKDGNPVFDLLISTAEEKPYRFHLLSSPISHLTECFKLTPLLFPCDPQGSGMFKIDMEVEHTAGRSLELKVENPRGFKGFKITRDEDKAEVEWDGRKLGKGEFSLMERRFQVSSGPHMFTANWKKNADDIDFLLDNKVHLNFIGMERNLDLDVDWGSHNWIDFDLSTPENIHFKLAANGRTPSLGNFTINRNIFFRSLNDILTLDLMGDTIVSLGPLATYSPVHTEIKAEFNTDEYNLTGDFKKVIAGQPYGVSFPKGIYSMPTVKFPSGLGFSIQMGTE